MYNTVLIVLLYEKMRTVFPFLYRTTVQNFHYIDLRDLEIIERLTKQHVLLKNSIIVVTIKSFTIFQLLGFH